MQIIRMREITGLPLVNRVLVTAQRMLPGQVIGIHSDRPLLGYELAAHIQALFTDVKFSELPTTLDPFVLAAESTLVGSLPYV